MADMIEIKHLNKYFGDLHVLKDINLTVKRGEKLVMIGPSGSGKSTLIRCVDYLEEPTSGEVIIDGTPLTKKNHLEMARKYSSMVFQQFNLYPNMTVLGNLTLAPIKLQKKSKEEATEIAVAALKRVGMAHKAGEYPQNLSGGQQQRIAIARAIVNEPKALLLDEPLGALDLKLRQDMQYELIRLKNELGISFIFVTHDQEEALTMSDIVVVMNQGRIQQLGTPQQIYNEPKNAFVAGFVGDSNIIGGTMLGDYAVELCDARWQCVDAGFGVNKPVDVVIRPEDVEFVAPEKGIIRGVVSHIIFKGLLWEMEVEAGGFTWLVQNTQMEPVGTEVGIYVKPENIQIMHKPTSDDEEALVNE